VAEVMKGGEMMASTQWDGTASGDALALTAKSDEGARVNGAMAEKESGSLTRELERWQAEQERWFNRAWRRPGGLARPAGL
jgi:hypothetical protein